MADKSAIEWTDATWNPVTGCDEVSPGCAHCYAKSFAERWRGTPGHPYENGFDLTLRPERLDQPLRWTKPRMVFVNSMSDLFHEDIPDEYIAQVFDMMAKSPQHTFQVLTKRPERMREFLAGRNWRDLGGLHFKIVPGEERPSDGPLPNVWLGVSIENRRFVHRADLLRETPAAVRFISAEPLLGPLVGEVAHGAPGEPHAGGRGGTGRAAATAAGPTPASSQARAHAPLDLTDIDWLIVGGESGAGHRRIDPQWVRDLRDAAVATGRCCVNRGGDNFYPARCDDCRGQGRHRGTAFFLKQWGGRTSKEGGRELDGRTWDEMPESAMAVST